MTFDLRMCKPGQAIWCKFTIGGLKATWIAYLYTTDGGFPVVVSAASLEECRRLRDARLEQTFMHVPKVGEVVETLKRDVHEPRTTEPDEPQGAELQRKLDAIQQHMAPPFSGPALRGAPK